MVKRLIMHPTPAEFHGKEHKVRAYEVVMDSRYVGVGALVSGVHCWLVRTVCV